MRVLLLRHASALPKEENAARPLSELGKKQAAFTGSAVASMLGAISGKLQIYHSGKERAAETASFLEKALVDTGAELVGPTVATDGLSPNDEPDSAMELMKQSADLPFVAFVGHLPFMHNFASKLLSAAEVSADDFGDAGGLLLEIEGEKISVAAKVATCED